MGATIASEDPASRGKARRVDKVNRATETRWGLVARFVFLRSSGPRVIPVRFVRGEIEIGAEQFDEPRPQIGIERLDQRAEIGLVQIARERAKRLGIIGLDRLGDGFDEGGPDLAFLVPEAD